MLAVTRSDRGTVARPHPTARRWLPLPAVLASAAVVAVGAPILLPAPAEPAAPQPSAAPASPAPAPTATPEPDVTWTTVAGVKLPVSRAHGPRRSTGGAAAGYSRSVTGAAIAAAHVLIRTSPGAGPHVFDPVLATQVTGANLPAMRLATRDEYQRLRAQSGVPDGAPEQAGTARIRGYVVRAVDLDAGDASVEVVLTSTDLDAQGRAVAFRVELRWQNDDWRVVAPADGDWGTAATPLGTLPSGLVTYGG